MVGRRSARNVISSNGENDGANPAAGSRSALPNKAAVQAPFEEGPLKRSTRLPLASKTNTPSSSDVEGKSGRGGKGSAKVTKQKGAKNKNAESSAVSASQRHSVSRDGRTAGTRAAAGSKMTGVGAASQPQKSRQSHVAVTGTLEKNAPEKVAMAKATSPIRPRPSPSIDSMAEMEADYVSRDPTQTVTQIQRPESPTTGPPRHSTPLQSKQRVISHAPGALLDKEMISPSRLPRQSDEPTPRLIDPYNDDKLNAEKLERVKSYVRTSSQAESSRSHGKDNSGRPLRFERIPSPVIAEQAREATNSGDEDDEFGFFAAARTAKMRQIAGTRPSEDAVAHGMGVARASKEAASAAAVRGDASDEELPTAAGLVERRGPGMEKSSAAMNGADVLRDILGSSASSSSSGQDGRASSSDDGHGDHPFYSRSLASKRTDGQGISKQSSASRSNGKGESQLLQAEQTGKKWRMEDTLKEVMPRKVAESRVKSSKQNASPSKKSKSQHREQERSDRRSTSQSKANSSRSLKRQQSELVHSTPPDESAPSAVRLRSASSARKATDSIVPLSRSGRPLRATSKKQDVHFESSSERDDSDGLGGTKKRPVTSQPLASKGSRSQSSSSGVAQKSRETSTRTSTQKRRKTAKSKGDDHESSDLWGFRRGPKADTDKKSAGDDLDDYSFEEELVL